MAITSKEICQFKFRAELKLRISHFSKAGCCIVECGLEDEDVVILRIMAPCGDWVEGGKPRKMARWQTVNSRRQSSERGICKKTTVKTFRIETFSLKSISFSNDGDR